MRNYGSREDARRRSAGEAATVLTVLRVVRRLGVVLGAAMEAAISELLRHKMIGTAEELRNNLNPLVDALCHFELEDLDKEFGDESDG